MVGICYEIWKYYNNEKPKTGAVLAAIGVVMILFMASYIMTPEIQEEIKNKDVVVPTYTATIIVTVEPNHVLLGKDYALYHDGKIKERFHLKAWEKKQFTYKITWTVSKTHSTTFELRSTGAGGINDGYAYYPLFLTDEITKEITLRA